MSDLSSVCVVGSPLGPLTIGADGRGIRFIEFGDRTGAVDSGTPDDPVVLGHLDRAVQELSEYFAGERSRFEVPLVVEGTDFQRAAWAALRSIDYGTVISYSEQAHRMGRPTATRAVGSANGRNPVPIIIPCHRVIAADGSIGGYSAGVAIKRWLLDHEQHRSKV